MKILGTKTALLHAMEHLKITDRKVFKTWRLEEQAYLEGLSAEPMIETLEMEYYQYLVRLDAIEYVLLNLWAIVALTDA